MRGIVAALATMLAAALLAAPAEAQRAETPREHREVPKPETTYSARLPASAPPPPPIEQDYAPNPAIWRLADDDTTIYLFGTFHALPRGFQWRSVALEQVIASVDELVLESRDDVSNPQEEAFLASLWTGGEGREPISGRLSEGNAAKWRKVVEGMGVDYAVIDSVPPALAMFAFAVTFMEEQGSEYRLGVESVLEREFHESKRPISAIEDPVQVIRSILAIDDSTIIASIDKALTEWDGEAAFNPVEGTGMVADLVAEQEGDDFAMEHQWARGLEDPNFLANWGEDAFGKALYQALIVDRNAQWTQWLVNRLDTPGNLLVAVGAGHFEGDDAVQRMLADKGFYVERLTPPVPAEVEPALETTSP